MARLIFNAADLRRVVEHSINAKAQAEQLVDYDKDFNPITMPVEKPAVILAKDTGIYLMSNGSPGDPLDPAKAGEEHFSRYVAYAKGCDPAKDEDYYHRARDLVGGDDFGETLPWAEAIKTFIDRGAKQIIVNFGARNISLSAK